MYGGTHQLQSASPSISMKRLARAFVLVVALMAFFQAAPLEAISCGTVQGSMLPCMTYLTSGGQPPQSCCEGVRSLARSIQSQEDKQTACYCLKSAASSYGIQSDAAANLAGKCGVSIGAPVAANTDCNQIS